MKAEEAIKKMRTVFWVQTAVIAAITALFEAGLLPQGFDVQPDERYIFQIVSVLFTIAGIPFWIMSRRRIVRGATESKTDDFIGYFCNRSLICLTGLGAITLLDIMVYYFIDYTGAFYCALLALCATIYCYPRREILDKYITEYNDKE